jgi:hypothetical protein
LRVKLRSLFDYIFRRLPVSRSVYLQRDALQARIDILEAQFRAQAEVALEPVMSAPRAYDPRQLETQVPVMCTVEERIQIATRCRDADVLPKVADAGAVIRQPDGTAVQIMHNGVKVLAGGYYGDWMQELITRCRGHHEPQEELLFAEVLRHLPGEATMIELGGFWSFY